MSYSTLTKSAANALGLPNDDVTMLPAAKNEQDAKSALDEFTESNPGKKAGVFITSSVERSRGNATFDVDYEAWDQGSEEDKVNLLRPHVDAPDGSALSINSVVRFERHYHWGDVTAQPQDVSQFSFAADGDFSQGEFAIRWFFGHMYLGALDEYYNEPNCFSAPFMTFDEAVAAAKESSNSSRVDFYVFPAVVDVNTGLPYQVRYSSELVYEDSATVSVRYTIQKNHEPTLMLNF